MVVVIGVISFNFITLKVNIAIVIKITKSLSALDSLTATDRFSPFAAPEAKTAAGARATVAECWLLT